MKRKMKAGITSVSLPIFVQDTSSTTGGGLSLAHNASGLTAKYRRQGQNSWTTITLAAGTLGTWSSGGWVATGEITGSYEVGIPDAAVASGARWVQIIYYGATNMLPVLIEIELDAVDYQTAIPTQVDTALIGYAGATGVAQQDTSLAITSDIGALITNVATLLTRLSALRAGYLDNLNVGGLVASAAAAGAIQAKTDNLPTDPADASDISNALTIIDDFLDTEVQAILTAANAIKAKTDNLPADPADQSDIMNALTVIDDLLDTEIAALPSAATIVAALKNEDEWKTILANANGDWTFTPPASFPGVGQLVLKSKDSLTTYATFDVTLNADKVATQRNSL